jgi:hypothetical protein
MSVAQRQNVSYGLSQPLITNNPTPVISKRSPTVSDFAVPTTIWTNILTSQVYILASIIANSATWVSVAGGAGAFASLTVTPGPISLTGATSINTTGGATTTIGTGGTGLVNIGNATSGTAISGSLITSGGTVNINDSGAFATAIAIAPGTGTLSLGNATGNVTIPAGNLNITLGDINLNAGRAINFTGSTSILSGNGDPNGAVGAIQGSLFLRTNGTDGTSRAYINTDGLTTWTAILTAG